jgi:hypothetical protein
MGGCAGVTGSTMLCAYAAAWCLLTICAVASALSEPQVRSELGTYLKFIVVPWKVAAFIPAAGFVTFAGRFAYDETWDVVSGGGMSLLTFLTAPWAVGLFYRCGKRIRPRHHEFYALIACLFSASWFYDGWLLVRDGAYPESWLPNLGISPALYLLGGAFWSLELDQRGRPTFGFLRQNWPNPPVGRQVRPALVAVAVPAMLVAAAILIFSVKWRL